MKTNLPNNQKGAVAIEFAAVFVIFFAVFYGMISYSLPLLLMQSFNHATAEAVRRSVALDPNSPNYAQNVAPLAKQIVREQLEWIPSTFQFLPAHIDATFTAGVLKVEIKYPSSNIAAVMPFIVLPGIGSVPKLPTTLHAKSSLQF
ncbi:pilus assembly protein [Pseudomonas sp. 15FMM2]|uniref:Pilus assembly protein n=1 Tax=Pseudomonas imrae TaxID=2992837 RepID=A0ACC7PAH4_9PSED